MPTARRLMGQEANGKCNPEPNNGWWTVPDGCCIVAYQAKGAVSLSASYKNLAWTGKNNIRVVSPPDWNSTDGWVCHGRANSVDLETGVFPEKGWSWAIRTTNSGTAWQASAFGCTTRVGGSGSFFDFRLEGNGKAKFGNGNSEYFGTDRSGVFVAAGLECYQDGNNVGTISGWHSGATPYTDKLLECVIGGSRTSRGVVVGFYGNASQCNIEAIAFYSNILTPQGVKDLSNRMAVL